MKNASALKEDFKTTLGEVIEETGQMDTVREAERRLKPAVGFFRSTYSKYPTLITLVGIGAGLLVARAGWRALRA